MAAGMRRSEVSALRWTRRAEVRDLRFVKGGVARPIWTLMAAANPAPADRVVPLSPKMVGLPVPGDGTGWPASST